MQIGLKELLVHVQAILKSDVIHNMYLLKPKELKFIHIISWEFQWCELVQERIIDLPPN